MSTRNPEMAPVRGAMSAHAPLRVEIEAGSPFELLIGMYATGTPSEERDRSWAPRLEDCPAATRAALTAFGERAGEIWLHLLGLALENPAGDAATFVASVSAMKPLELRRHLLGTYVPAWVEMIGVDVLEKAVRGDTRAAKRLLTHDRYYGGRAQQSLAALLPLRPAETKQRILAALTAYANEVFCPEEDRLRVELQEDAAAKRLLAASVTGGELITASARGYVYEPEPEFSRVVLVPHVAARPWSLLCQHRGARIICYGVSESELDPERARADGLERLGRALGDSKRVAILLRLSQSQATFAELAAEVGLARSTTHHHLAQLRAAGLIVLHGNARRYHYTLDPKGLAAAEALLRSFAKPS
jgi:DNA-binding transcriptional ArsR family regulator